MGSMADLTEDQKKLISEVIAKGDDYNALIDRIVLEQQFAFFRKMIIDAHEAEKDKINKDLNSARFKRPE